MMRRRRNKSHERKVRSSARKFLSDPKLLVKTVALFWVSILNIQYSSLKEKIYVLIFDDYLSSVMSLHIMDVIIRSHICHLAGLHRLALPPDWPGLSSVMCC